MSDLSEKVSLIIPTHNRAETLKITVDSLLQQKGLKEIIFVDDSAEPASRIFLSELAQKNKLVRLILLDKKVGLPAARNIAIKEATGDFILFGDDDVIFDDNYTAQLLACLERTGADIISGRIIYLNDGESKADAILRADQEQQPLINEELLTLRGWKRLPVDEPVLFTHACVLVKKAVFDQCLFDDSIQGNAYREDTDFQIRAAKQGFKIYFCPHTQLYHLPRDLIKGGCGFAEINPLLFVFYRLRNNYSFLKKHYKFLKTKTGHKYSLPIMILFALAENMKFLGSKLIKSFKGKK